MGQKFRQHYRDVAFLEVPRQQREASEQTEKVDEDDPFVAEMSEEPGRAGAGFETGEHHLVNRNRHQSDESDPERVVMKKRDAEQSQPKQDEIDGDAEDEGNCRRGNQSSGERHEPASAADERAKSKRVPGGDNLFNFGLSTPPVVRPVNGNKPRSSFPKRGRVIPT